MHPQRGLREMVSRAVGGTRREDTAAPRGRGDVWVRGLCRKTGVKAGPT